MRATNLLVLMSDEHNPKFLGAGGHPFIATPNLDALAARGTRFTAAYTTCPICLPARAAFAVGRYVAEALQTATVTFRKVAEINVAPLSELLFSRSNSASSSRWRSADLPFCSAAANALIVGP